MGHSMRIKKDEQASPNGLTALLATGHCDRCGGLLVGEHCTDLLDSTGQMEFPALRCVQCGEVVDLVILHNRHHARSMENTYQRPTKWDTHYRGTDSVQ